MLEKGKKIFVSHSIHSLTHTAKPNKFTIHSASVIPSFSQFFSEEKRGNGRKCASGLLFSSQRGM